MSQYTGIPIPYSQASFLGTNDLSTRVRNLESTIIPIDRFESAEDNVFILQGNVSNLENDVINLQAEIDNISVDVNTTDLVISNSLQVGVVAQVGSLFMESGTLSNISSLEFNTPNLSTLVVEENVYKKSNGVDEHDHQVRLEETPGTEDAAWLTKTRIVNFTGFTNTSSIRRFGAYSVRQVFNLTRPTGTQDMIFDLNLPYVNGNSLVIDHQFLICRLGSNITSQIVVNGIDNGSGATTGDRFGFMTTKEYSSGSMISATSSIITSTATIINRSWKGEIKLKLNSCGNGIDGNGAFLIDVEIWNA